MKLYICPHLKLYLAKHISFGRRNCLYEKCLQLSPWIQMLLLFTISHLNFAQYEHHVQNEIQVTLLYRGKCRLLYRTNFKPGA